MDGISKVLHLDLAISLLQQPELDRILCRGEAPTRWTRSHYFPPPGDTTPATIPICCGPWHSGTGHFVTFYICQEYWSILDPLEDDLLEPTRLQRKLHRALRESFSSRNLPTPPLPSYRQFPKIAIQRNAPWPLWSCGTFAVSITLHLLLGGIPPPFPPHPVYLTGIHDVL